MFFIRVALVKVSVHSSKSLRQCVCLFVCVFMCVNMCVHVIYVCVCVYMWFMSGTVMMSACVHVPIYVGGSRNLTLGFFLSHCTLSIL